MDTRHAVGCAALRGGVPCTCWLDEPPKVCKPPADHRLLTQHCPKCGLYFVEGGE